MRDVHENGNDRQTRSKAKVIIGIVMAIIVLVLGAMLLIGLLQGDDVDREENPVRGHAAGSVSQRV